MSSQGQYRDEKLWKEKRCHIAEQQEISTTWEERTVSQIFNNLKEADCRKGIFRREIWPSLCFLPFQQKQDTSQIRIFFLYKSCCKILSKSFWSLNKRIRNCRKQLGFEMPQKSWSSNVAQLDFVQFTLSSSSRQHNLNIIQIKASEFS